MTVGFSDVLLLRDLFRKEKSITTSSLKNLKKDFFNKRVRQVATVNILAEALYRVFSNYGLFLFLFIHSILLLIYLTK